MFKSPFLLTSEQSRCLNAFGTLAFWNSHGPQKRCRLFVWETFSQNIYQVPVSMADTVLDSRHRVHTWKSGRLSYIIKCPIQDLSLILHSATKLLIPKCKISHATLFILKVSRISIVLREKHIFLTYPRRIVILSSLSNSQGLIWLSFFQMVIRCLSVLFFKIVMRS